MTEDKQPRRAQSLFYTHTAAYSRGFGLVKQYVRWLLLVCLLLIIVLCGEWHLYAHDAWVASSLVLETSHGATTFYWIATREGLTSRFNQMEIIHSQVSARNRTLSIVDNPSVHYKDLATIRLCDVFVLPSSILCSFISPNVLVQKRRCFMQNITEQNHLVQGFAIRTGYASSIARVSEINWDAKETACGLLYGYNFPLQGAPLRVVFTPRYTALLDVMLDHLGASFRTRDYIAIHWRRGDQRQKCDMARANERAGLARDDSVNCGTVADLITTVEKILKAETGDALVPRKVYIATNEKSPEILAALSAQGYKLFRDAFAPGDPDFPHYDGSLLGRTRLSALGGPLSSAPPLTSLDVFVLELQLMAEARAFYGWGPTGVRAFVERIRRERSPSKL